jgi:hypothetical protein
MLRVVSEAMVASDSSSLGDSGLARSVGDGVCVRSGSCSSDAAFIVAISCGVAFKSFQCASCDARVAHHDGRWRCDMPACVERHAIVSSWHTIPRKNVATVMLGARVAASHRQTYLIVVVCFARQHVIRSSIDALVLHHRGCALLRQPIDNLGIIVRSDSDERSCLFSVIYSSNIYPVHLPSFAVPFPSIAKIFFTAIVEVDPADLRDHASNYQLSRGLNDVLIGEDTALPLLNRRSAGDITTLRAILEQYLEIALVSPHRIYKEDRPANDKKDVRGVLASKRPNLEIAIL